LIEWLNDHIENRDFIEICKKKLYYRLRFKNVGEGEKFLKKLRLVLKRENTTKAPKSRDDDTTYSLQGSYSQTAGTYDKGSTQTPYSVSVHTKSSHSGTSVSASSYSVGSYSGSVRSMTASGVSQKSNKEPGDSSEVYSSDVESGTE